ncbi:hypothetical protein SJAV_01870 [Sulfurisphaera javensis]|uniref:Flagellin n=1 Tax=Sulfurisphaera javensis TaxID=2049879 RepID=A0AAT9GN40_9CREN
MESSVVAFILIIATILIGLVVFSLSSVFASYQYNTISIQTQAENIANGLYVTISNNESISNSNNITLFIVPQDFNYHGIIYLTVFYVPSYFKQSSDEITPQLAYTSSGKILYGLVNGTTTGKTYNTILYSTSLKEMYEGEITLWKTVTGAPQVLTLSPPNGYTPIVMFFVQIQGKFVEVGYEWL